ncbi:hypothetical protein DYI37_18045 [Fulvimarina endophytica]|uniref:PilZ domain-containing protein n=1 Tax=Fulvimarina endophytica TaxID=2293836 RepID=A0A371WYT0_9HYPH|nr:PilZ domain-containing protein [Fulvimarina endophytica]RFC62141.1 hypothetical protein DYI37_18045 [Fulvimarina endophytica]
MTVPSPIRQFSDQRYHNRRRVRLRPVKLVSQSKRFIEDGSVVDLSEGGIRIRRFGDRLIPQALLVFDESDETLRPATVIWRVRDELGLRFTGMAEGLEATDRARLAGRYYAVR